MSVACSLGFIFMFLDLQISAATSTLTASLQSDCACYGNDVTIDSVMPSCTTSGDIIAINSAYRAAKFTNSSCPQIASAGVRDEVNCCTYNAAKDCQVTRSPGDPTVASVFTDCAGAASCSKQVTWTDTITNCPSGYLTQTNYMCMEYYCFPTADAAPFCDGSGTTYSGTQLYVYNDNYPSAISSTSCCACVVTATAASATIDVNLIDFRLYDETGTCVQALLVEDGTSFASYGCTTNNDFFIGKLMTSTTNSVTVTLQNNATTTNGYVWIGVTVSNGALSMACGAVAQCPDGSTTTTSAATTTTAAITTTAAPATATSDSDAKKTLIFGLSVLHSSLVIAAALLLLLLLVVLVACCIGYMFGSRKRYNVTEEKDKTPDKQADTNRNKTPRSPPPSYYSRSPTPRKPPAFSRTPLYQGRSHDISRNTMFTYRQFDNQYQPRRFGRRSSLTRVDSY